MNLSLMLTFIIVANIKIKYDILAVITTLVFHILLPWTLPDYQEPAQSYWAQFGPLYRFYTEFLVVLLYARDQYIKQQFCAIILLPDDGALLPETCSI